MKSGGETLSENRTRAALKLKSLGFSRREIAGVMGVNVLTVGQLIEEGEAEERADTEVTFTARMTPGQLADLAIRTPELLPYIRANRPIPISPDMLLGGR